MCPTYALTSVLVLTLVGCVSNAPMLPNAAVASSPDRFHTNVQIPCPLPPQPTGAPGSRRLALLVGVSAPRVPGFAPLASVPEDLRQMADLLTGTYGFPPENICVIADDTATTAAVITAFREALTSRAAPGDEALFYYSGHGSRARDTNGDEPSGWDDVLLTADAGDAGAPGLRDDRVNSLLAELGAKTSKVTVILDECSSGSATKGGQSLNKTGPAFDQVYTDEPPAPGERGWAPASLPGMVRISATRDGGYAGAPTTHGPSYLTGALVSTLKEPWAQTPTWRAVELRVAPMISRLWPIQEPVFQGATERQVFGDDGAAAIVGWEVTDTPGGELELTGAPHPSGGVGARVALYPAGTRRAQMANPERRIATAEIVQVQGIVVRARVLGPPVHVPLGAVAALVQASPSARPLRVALDLSPEARAALIEPLASSPDRAMVQLDAAAPEVTVREGPASTLDLINAHGVRIASLESGAEVADRLVLLAWQRSLAHISGGSPVWPDEQTLEVRLVPERGGPYAAAQPHAWFAARPNQTQPVALCDRYRVEVKNTSDTTLSIGGYLLSSDGQITTLPEDGSVIEVVPGKTALLGPPNLWEAKPPAEVLDRVVVVGSTTETSLQWLRLLPRGVKGGSTASPPDGRWTTSHVDMLVTANPELRSLDPALDLESRWNGTDLPLDLRPFLNAAGTPALRALLGQTVALESAAARWDGPAAIHAAFRGAKLDYPRAVGTSVDAMLDRTAPGCGGASARPSPMEEDFDSCLQLPPAAGDVLVFQGAGSCQAQVELLIDPVSGAAWGDGPGDGVGYRLSGLTGQDTRDPMVACWRHRALIPESDDLQVVAPHLPFDRNFPCPEAGDRP